MFADMPILMKTIVFVVYSTILVIFGYFFSRLFVNKKVQDAQGKAKDLLESTSREIDNRKKEAELAGKDLMIKLRQDFERETKDRREELMTSEKRILQKEENLDKRVDLLEKKEKDISSRITQLHSNEEILQKKNETLSQVIEQEKQQLQKISSLTPEEAKQLLLDRLEDDLTKEKATRIREMEEEINDNVDKTARNIISKAIQHCASDHTAENTVSVVPLPSDEMKGRIIGREGRNIRALEAATGVDIIIDDTPEAVTISGFDMFRREIARIALNSLIADGRIHPERIEEVVDRAKKDLESKIKEEGERLAFDLGVHAMHPELLKLIGKLKYRTSYGQNALQHTREVAFLTGSMSSQIGLDPLIGVRAGLLHDIGKVVNQDVEEGTHALVGANLAKKYGETEAVVKAIASHHEEVEMNTTLGVLVCAADAISASRPGARAETLETYVKRLESLETIANAFKGVDKAYALQAGREIRILVNPEKINDDEAIVLARDVRKRVEQEMEYPGHIKVIVLRETRIVEYAK